MPTAPDASLPSGSVDSGSTTNSDGLPLGVFVSAAHGSDNGDGTAARPYATFSRAIADAQSKRLDVIACAERFDERIDVSAASSALTLRGGFDCTSPKWTRTDALTVIQPGASPALRLVGTANVVIDGLQVVAPSGGASTDPKADGNSVAVEIHGASKVEVVHSALTAGNGRDGKDGVTPSAYVLSNIGGQGADGAPGLARAFCGATTDRYCSHSSIPYYNVGGAGGSAAACLGDAGHPVFANPGGNGGRGGFRMWIAGRVFREDAGEFGIPTTETAQTALGGTLFQSGVDGRSGPKGVDGRNGHALLTGQGYAPGDSEAGANGGLGQGGGGGGGDAWNDAMANISILGASGGGGGVGGCPGRGGTPAQGGGASIALFVDATSLTIDGTSIATGDGGRGGSGAPASTPTDGGRGGSGDPGRSGNGGNGGRGGLGGASGSAAGGASYGIVYTATSPSLGTVTYKMGKGGSVPTVGVVSPGEVGDVAERKRVE